VVYVPMPMRIMRQAVVPVEHLPELSGNKNLEDLESQARHSVPLQAVQVQTLSMSFLNMPRLYGCRQVSFT